MIQVKKDGVVVAGGNGDVQRAVRLIDLSSPDKVADAISVTEAPALIYHLGTRLLETASDATQMSKAMALWTERRPASLSGLNEGDTPFSRAALAIVSILDERGHAFFPVSPIFILDDEGDR